MAGLNDEAARHSRAGGNDGILEPGVDDASGQNSQTASCLSLKSLFRAPRSLLGHEKSVKSRDQRHKDRPFGRYFTCFHVEHPVKACKNTRLDAGDIVFRTLALPERRHTESSQRKNAFGSLFL
jgi:hypothetical protein